MQSQPLRAWELGLTTSHRSQVLNPTYDMDDYMATLFLFYSFLLGGRGGEGVGLSKKLDPTLNTKSHK